MKPQTSPLGNMRCSFAQSEQYSLYSSFIGFPHLIHLGCLTYIIFFLHSAQPLPAKFPRRKGILSDIADLKFLYTFRQTCIPRLFVFVLYHFLKYCLTPYNRQTFFCPCHRSIQQIPVIKKLRARQKRNDNCRIFAPCDLCTVIAYASSSSSVISNPYFTFRDSSNSTSIVSVYSLISVITPISR